MNACLVKTCPWPPDGQSFFCAQHGTLVPKELHQALLDAIRDIRETVHAQPDWTPAERAQLASGTHVVEILHGVSRIRACAEFPPTKPEPWVTPKIGASRGATLTTKEARRLGLLK